MMTRKRVNLPRAIKMLLLPNEGSTKHKRCGTIVSKKRMNPNHAVLVHASVDEKLNTYEKLEWWEIPRKA